MKNPITDMTANLLFTRHGTVWATWSLMGRPYGMKPLKDKKTVRALHAALYRTVRGEALIMGLTSSIGPASVVGATIEGVDLASHPGAIDEAEANLDRLAGLYMGARLFYLSVPLPNVGVRAVREPLRAAWHGAIESLGAPVSTPSQDEITYRLAQAEAFRHTLPSAFEATPVTVQDHLWIFEHACLRGIVDAEQPRAWDGQVDDSVIRMSAMPTPTIDVAGQSDVSSRTARINPLSRRYLKVTTDRGDSYQTSLTVAGVPPEGLTFPGGEWLGSIDVTGVRVDWAQRLTVRASKEVTRKNLRSIRELNDQIDQRSADAAHYFASGGLESRASDLAEYVSLLESDENEVETETTTILTIAGATREEMDEAVDTVEQVVGRNGWRFKLARDPGRAQEDLWWESMPGTPTSALTRSRSQITTSRSLAAAAPITTTQVGDYTGPLVAVLIQTGILSPVLIDLEHAARTLNIAPCLGIVGELGSGKSYALKTIASLMADRGSHIVAIDRSERGEWVKALRSIDDLRAVSVGADAMFSLDPLRVLDADVAPQYAQNLLQALLGVAATSSQAGLLGEILETQYRSARSLHTLADVVEHLGTLEGDMAQDMHRRLSSFTRKALTRVIFDPTLPALSLDDRAIVFRTQALDLPTKKDLEAAHLFASMSIEKVFSRAVYALIVAVGRMICFANPTRLDVLVADEAHALTLSEESTRDLEYLVRDGRKHLGGLLIGSHDPREDFGDSDVLRRLISWRLVMRHRDEALAARAIEWLGLDPNDEDLIDLVTKNLSPVPEGAQEPDPARLGEALVRDGRNRYGQVKVLGPASGTRAQDLDSRTLTEVLG